MNKSEKFIGFLDSLKNGQNDSLIESVKKGYSTLNEGEFLNTIGNAINRKKESVFGASELQSAKNAIGKDLLALRHRKSTNPDIQNKLIELGKKIHNDNIPIRDVVNECFSWLKTESNETLKKYALPSQIQEEVMAHSNAHKKMVQEQLGDKTVEALFNDLRNEKNGKKTMAMLSKLNDLMVKFITEVAYRAIQKYIAPSSIH